MRRKHHVRRIEIRHSSHGKGVFAVREFPAETLVGRIRGKLTLDDEHDPRYCMEMDGDWLLIPHAPFRFLNHSCDPNCHLLMFDDDPTSFGGRSRPLYVETLRRIDAGEELTIDYGWPAYFAIPCACKSGKCRGWIVDPEDLPELLRQHRPRKLVSQRRHS